MLEDYAKKNQAITIIIVYIFKQHKSRRTLIINVPFREQQYQ